MGAGGALFAAESEPGEEAAGGGRRGWRPGAQLVGKLGEPAGSRLLRRIEAKLAARGQGLKLLQRHGRLGVRPSGGSI